MDAFFSRLFPFFTDERKAAFAQSANRILTAVCVTVAVALSLFMIGLRFAYLTNGLQYDELYSAITASPYLSWGFIWRKMLLQDINLPLYNFLLFIWNRIFPYTYVWMHLFSALTGTLAVVMTWVLAPAYWSKIKKLIFTSLTACSFILVAYGAIIRTYSLAVLLSIVFSLLALRFMDQFKAGQNPSCRMWLTFFAVGLVGSYCHFFCTGLFFITALVLFIYACHYKVGRAWAFWGTAVVFGLWSFWLVHVARFLLIPGVGASWWYKTPFFKASFEIVTFLFGPPYAFRPLLYGLVLAGVSLISCHKKELFKQADLVLSVSQILLLLGVVALVSLRVNLWMDRYFLPLLPSCILLFTICLDHLRRRHWVLIILWPLLLGLWVRCFENVEHLDWKEYTGLQDTFTHLTQSQPTSKILVYFGKTGYPQKAFEKMLSFYVPADKTLEIIPFTAETASLAWSTEPKIPVLLPLCSKLRMIDLMTKTQAGVDNKSLLIFGRDTCLFTAHLQQGELRK